MLDDFVERLETCGVKVPDGPFGSRRITSLEHCRELLADAGLVAVSAECEQIGYHLNDEKDWWELISSTGMRALFDQLPEDRKETLRKEHLASVADMKTGNGLWLDVLTRLASGIKSEQ